jgi:hypothetical protein
MTQRAYPVFLPIFNRAAGTPYFVEARNDVRGIRSEPIGSQTDPTSH